MYHNSLHCKEVYFTNYNVEDESKRKGTGLRCHWVVHVSLSHPQLKCPDPSPTPSPQKNPTPSLSSSPSQEQQQQQQKQQKQQQKQQQQRPQQQQQQEQEQQSSGKSCKYGLRQNKRRPSQREVRLSRKRLL